MPLSFKPTLAKTYEPNNCSDVYWAQAKVDGVRCISTKENGDIILYTRHGNAIDGFSKIKRELQKVLEEGDIIDGELFSENWRCKFFFCKISVIAAKHVCKLG